jgi:hypothetical protein
MDELDRILSEEHSITTPLGFSRRVMAAVQQEATTPAPIPFPWRHALATLAAMVIAVIACRLFPGSLPPWVAAPAALAQRAFTRIDPMVLTWCSSAIFAAVALIRYSVRFITD